MAKFNLKSAISASIIALAAGLSCTAVRASSVIYDRFDDGALSTNSLGIGSGFQVFTQSDGRNPSTAAELGGSAVLGTGPTCVYCISAIASKDAFSVLSPGSVTRVTWSIGGTSFDPRSTTRDYMSVISSNFQSYDSRLNPHDSNVPGIYVRLEDPEPLNGHVAGFAGGIVVEDGSGFSDELAAWNWSGIWDRMGPLDIILDLTSVGFSVTLNGDLGSATAMGNWSGIVNARGFVSAMRSSNAVVGAQNQGLFGIGSTTIDMISVSTVPEPGTLALIGFNLVALGLLRRRISAKDLRR